MLLLLVLATAACSGSDDAAPAGTGPTVAPTTSPSTMSPTTVATPAITTPLTSEETAATVFATVPDTGVAGIDSDDLFCRSWSRFAGSFQALALASALASDPSSAVVAELAASGAIVAAVAGLDEHLPGELDDERDALTIDLAGPMLRRAERAGDELRAAGVTDDDIDVLAQAWLTALADAGVDQPDIVVDIPAELRRRVESAAAAFAAEVPPIVTDPSLVTNASAPRSEAYIAERCPDQGTLGGNDVIDQP
jgi:hypothetical protein